MRVKPFYLASAVLVILLFLAPGYVLAGTMIQPVVKSDAWRLKVDPALLKLQTTGPELYMAPFKPEGVGNPGKLVFRPREGMVAVFIVSSPRLAPSMLRGMVDDLMWTMPLGSMTLSYAWIKPSGLKNLASNPLVYRVIMDKGLINQLQPRTSIEALEKPSGKGVSPDLYKAVDVIGAKQVWESYNITGEGVKVGIVDSGLDFGSSDLGVDAIARAEDGTPLVFDADGAGLVLTFTTVHANATGYINIPEEGVLVWDIFGGGVYSTTLGFTIVVGPLGVYYNTYPLKSWYVGSLSPTGEYKFGLAVEFMNTAGGLAYFSAPAIVVDSNADGSYDTVYIDLSTTWYYVLQGMNATGLTDMTPSPSWLDFSFTDEQPVRYGSEVVARDFTGDGINDFSMGELAGYYYDAWGVLRGVAPYMDGWRNFWEAYGLVFPGLDPNGNYFDLVYDYYGHGTACAHVVASRGRIPHYLGYGEDPHYLKGIAPGAKLGAAPALFLLGDVLTSQLFLSGFDLTSDQWTWNYTGSHKVDVISNSWGASALSLIGFASGLDPASLMQDYIVYRSGTVIVHAMGNGGPGWGTATIPGAGFNMISVGASTLFDYRPYYGYLPGAWGEVISWSDRGPTQLGVVKPDVVNIGSFAWSVLPVIYGLGDGTRTADIFGGTSEATPMTSGSAALLIAAYKAKHGEAPSPDMVKVLLKNYARDLGHDPFTQGSGQVDIYAAVKAVLDGSPIVYTYDSSRNFVENTGLTQEELGMVLGEMADAQLYTGAMLPGEEKTMSLTIEGTGTANITATTFKLVSEENAVPSMDVSRAMVLDYAARAYYPAADYISVSNETLYVNLSASPVFRVLIPIDPSVFGDADLVSISVYYPYSYLDPFGRSGTYGYMFYAGVELSLWADIYGYGVPVAPATARVSYDIRLANVYHIDLGHPEAKFELAKKAIEDYLGMSLENTTVMPVLDLRILVNRWYYYGGGMMPVHIVVQKYRKAEWSWINAPSTVEFNGKTSFNVTISVPSDASPGIYEGFLEVNTGVKNILVPVSVPVAVDLSKGYALIGGERQQRLYDNYAFKGAFDWSWRYESGDWRTFPVVITDPGALGLTVMVNWPDDNSAVDLAVAGPGIPYLALETPEDIGVVDGAVTGAKLSIPLGGGWFTHFDYPTSRTTGIFAEVIPPEPGSRTVYWITLHQTLYGGTVFPEPYTMLITLDKAEPAEPSVTLASTGTASTNVTVTLPGFGASIAYAMPVALIPVDNGFQAVPLDVLNMTVASTQPGLMPNNTLTISISTSGTPPGTYIIGIVVESESLAQIAIGYMLGGYEYMESMPASVIIPVVVSVQG